VDARALAVFDLKTTHASAIGTAGLPGWEVHPK
jgi:hypothetical protein